jgi:hypothetical protein
MDENQERIKKMYLRINGEMTDREIPPPPPKKGKTKTFTLDEDQVKKLEGWQEHIRAIYGEYGHYEYRFSSSGIGQMVEVYSQLTKTTIDLTDVDKW